MRDFFKQEDDVCIQHTHTSDRLSPIATTSWNSVFVVPRYKTLVQHLFRVLKPTSVSLFYLGSRYLFPLLREHVMYESISITKLSTFEDGQDRFVRKSDSCLRNLIFTKVIFHTES